MSMNDPILLLVEDDPAVRRFLRTSLPPQGYQLIEAETGREGLTLAAQYLPDVVLLDLGLPDVDGVEVIVQLRAWSLVPILVISARELERQKIAALDAGADDYLTKPFGFGELLARVRVALRHAARRNEPTPSTFQAGPLEVDLAAHQVLLDGVEVHLTPIEHKLLAVLVRHAGRVVTHKQLHEAVWGPRPAGDPTSLRVYMMRLRRKLQRAGRLFTTETGVGYRLVEGDREERWPPG
jgi:two-component system KDP operon response regulator KdpE